MTDEHRRLHELTAGLEQAAQRLRDGDLAADAAAALVEDCARLAGEASQELERLARAAAAEDPPAASGQLELADPA